MNRRLALALALLASFVPAIAFGLGLGDIRLHSALNQPLDVEIDLLSASEDEINSIKVRLASNEQFDRYGIERSAVLQSFKFEVVKRPDGRAYIHVTSDTAVREPFLTFLIEASWPRGRLLREYTILLDPPVLAPAPGDENATSTSTTAQSGGDALYAVAVPAPATTRPAVSPAAPEPTTAPVVATPVAAEPVEPQSTSTYAPTPEPVAESAPMAGAAEYGPVRRGETLWAIAMQMKAGQSVTINQMMLAVYRANPDAFRGNINRLKRGAILRIPDAAELAALTVSEANAEARRQNEEWQSTRVAATPAVEPMPAAAPATTPTYTPAPVAQPEPEPAAPAPVVTKQPEPAPVTAAPSTPATAASGTDASLSIVAPADNVGAPSTDPAARVADLEKQLADAKAAGTNTKRKRDKIARLEQELNDARAALTVSSDTLAQMQGSAPATTPAASAPTVAPTPTTVATPATVAPEPAPADKPATPAKHKKGAFDAVLDNLMNPFVLGGLVVLVLAVFGGIVAAKKLKARKAAAPASVDLGAWDEASSDEDKTVVGGDDPTAQAAQARAASAMSEEKTVMRGPDPALLAATGETVAIPDEQVQKTVMLPRDELDKTIMQTMAVEQPATMVMGTPSAAPAAASAPHSETVVGGTPLKLDENDPISEADFHMAYGLYDQAADLIKKASQREPGRRDLRLKLLEIHFSAGNKGAFVSEAKALRESMGPRPDADWNNVVIFGKQIAPEEGMFNEMASSTAAVDFDASAAAGPAAPSNDLEFDPFAAPEPAPAPAPAAAAPSPAAESPVVEVPLEFELGDFEVGEAAKPAAPPAPPRGEPTDSQSDFDKALAELSAFVDTNVPKVEGKAPAVADDGALELGDLSIDDSALSVEDDSAGSEIDTKLDLARAYIDMMDPGSAKGILEEVLADGDEKQKAEAQKLLAGLG